MINANFVVRVCVCIRSLRREVDAIKILCERSEKNNKIRPSSANHIKKISKYNNILRRRILLLYGQVICTRGLTIVLLRWWSIITYNIPKEHVIFFIIITKIRARRVPEGQFFRSAAAAQWYNNRINIGGMRVFLANGRCSSPAAAAFTCTYVR